jgi:hypothetical protein
VRYGPGSRVRASAADPSYHTRLPRYARGHVGEVIEVEGEWPVPDDRARGIDPPRVETVYAVRFPAAELWGAGEHAVIVDLWESYLEEAG